MKRNLGTLNLAAVADGEVAPAVAPPTTPHEIENDFFAAEELQLEKKFADLSGLIKNKKEFYEFWSQIGELPYDGASARFPGEYGELQRRRLCQMQDKEGNTLLILAAKAHPADKQFMNF